MTTPLIGLSLFVYLFIGLIKKLEDFFVKTKRLSSDILAIFIVLTIGAVVLGSALLIVKESLKHETNISLISGALENRQAEADEEGQLNNQAQAGQIVHPLPIAEPASQSSENLSSPAGR